MVALAASVPVLLSVVGVSPAFAQTPSRVQLPSPNLPGLTGTVQPLDPTLPVDLHVYLADRPGLAAAATAVSDPHDPHYAHYLTPADVQQRYGTTAQQANAVSTWLTAQGMTITATTQHDYAVTATVAQIDAAFDTQVSEFDHTVTGKGQTRTVREPGVVGGFSVPAALAGDVLSVTGIEQIALSGGGSGPKAMTGRHAATANSADFQCSQYWGQYSQPVPAAYGHTTAPTQLCGYTPTRSGTPTAWPAAPTPARAPPSP